MSTSTATPLDVVQKFAQLLETMNFDEALDLVSDTCEYSNPPPIGAVTGRDGVRAALDAFLGQARENEFKILRAAAAGPVVLFERLDRHLFDKWIELPVTGVCEVHDGKITYWRDYFDAATLMSQMPAA